MATGGRPIILNDGRVRVGGGNSGVGQVVISSSGYIFIRIAAYNTDNDISELLFLSL